MLHELSLLQGQQAMYDQQIEQLREKIALHIQVRDTLRTPELIAHMDKTIQSLKRDLDKLLILKATDMGYRHARMAYIVGEANQILEEHWEVGEGLEWRRIDDPRAPWNS